MENKDNKQQDDKYKDLLNQSIEWIKARSPISKLLESYIAFILGDFANRIHSLKSSEQSDRIVELENEIETIKLYFGLENTRLEKELEDCKNNCK